MKIEAIDGALCRILGTFILTAALAGCGGGGSSADAAAGAAASGSTASVSSSSSNGTGLVALSSSAYTAAPATNALVTIYRVGSSQGTATVGYTTVNGSATAGVDYVTTAGSVSWQDGDATPKTVAVPVTSQASGKEFAFALTSIAGQASFGFPATATVGIAGNAGGGWTSGTVTLSWTAPTENTNGTALTNLAGYTIYYGTSATALTEKISISTVGMLNYVISNLSSGTWYFQIVAVNSSGVQSNPTSTVSATI